MFLKSLFFKVIWNWSVASRLADPLKPLIAMKCSSYPGFSGLADGGQLLYKMITLVINCIITTTEKWAEKMSRSARNPRLNTIININPLPWEALKGTLMQDNQRPSNQTWWQFCTFWDDFASDSITSTTWTWFYLPIKIFGHHSGLVSNVAGSQLHLELNLLSGQGFYITSLCLHRFLWVLQFFFLPPVSMHCCSQC